MLPTRPAVITRSRSLRGPEPAPAACGEAEPSGVDMAVGSGWIVVDDLLNGNHLSTIGRAPGHVARWFYGHRHDAAHPAVTRSDLATPLAFDVVADAGKAKGRAVNLIPHRHRGRP